MDESAKKRQETLEAAGAWIAFYRDNPHRLVSDYLHINLKLFQRILLNMMFFAHHFYYIASRGQGKTFLAAIYCVVRCILYPGTIICIAAGNKRQGALTIAKIEQHLLQDSPELRTEVSAISSKDINAYVTFNNGSVIKAVTPNDNSRGERCHVLIVDEFRMVKLGILNDVLRKFPATPRRPKYLDKLEYADYPLERNSEIFLSSAYFADHWSYSAVQGAASMMLDDSKRFYVCGLPYQVSVGEGLLSLEYVEEQMMDANFDQTMFDMEYGCEWFGGGSNNSFFNINDIGKTRTLQYPMLPQVKIHEVNNPKLLRIAPAEPGEIRILSVDVAVMGSTRHKNDATAIFINAMKATKSGKYTRNIVYLDAVEGMHTADQALLVRKLFDEFSCDWLIIDAKGNGIGIVDALLREINDVDTGEIYPALSCHNNEEIAARCHERGAKKVIWAINASAQFNHECAMLLRDAFRSGTIRLPINEVEAEEMLHSEKWFKGLSDNAQMKAILPYIQTTRLVDELIKLMMEVNGQWVKLRERSGMRKDRYSSLAYNIWVAKQIENEQLRKLGRAPASTGQFKFFTAPQTRGWGLLNG